MTEDKADSMEKLAQSIKVKSSRAVYLWAALICAVLILLWFETGHKPANNNNLLLSGEAQTVGATVFIDGENVGAMVDSNQSGVDGSAFYWHVNDGKHVIEVKKDGYDSFHKDIDLRSQGYVGVELKKSQIQKSDIQKSDTSN